MSSDLRITDRLSIPGEQLKVTFARSGGPGGQNVNKCNTKAVLRWNVVRSHSLPADVRGRFIEQFQTRINGLGELILASDAHREQLANRRACEERLRSMILSVLAAPKRRIRTKPSRASQQRRLNKKREQSEKKRQRRFRGDRDL